MFITKNTQTVGIDIGSHSIKLVRLKKKKQAFELVNFGLMPLHSEAIIDGVIEDVEGVADALKRLLACEKIKVKHAVASVAGEAVIIKKISVPVMREAELADSIRSEAEQYIPCDIDEVNVDFQILPKTSLDGEGPSPKGEDEMDVILAAIKKDVIESRVAVLTSAGLHPVVMDLDVLALENCFEVNGAFAPGCITALVNIGANATNINIVEEGITAFTRDIALGANVFNRAIRKELQVSADTAERLKLGIESDGATRRQIASIVINAVADLTREIFKSFEFYSTARNREVDEVVLSGGAVLMPGLDRQIAERLGKKTDVMNPFLNIRVNAKAFDLDYLHTVGPLAAVGVGLASRRFGDRE